MNILIFGATGTIGQQLVIQGLEQHHTVTAFARNPDKLKISHQQLSLVQGDVLQKEEVSKTMNKQDAVLIALGAGSKGTVRSAGTRNIMHAMEEAAVHRLICLSTLGAGDSRENLNLFWKYVMFGFFLRQAYNDHLQQESLIQKSSLEWTIVRPGAFIDGALTGQYRHGFPPNAKDLELKISRADVADFMLKQLDDNSYLYKTPGLSY